MGTGSPSYAAERRGWVGPREGGNPCLLPYWDRPQQPAGRPDSQAAERQSAAACWSTRRPGRSETEGGNHRRRMVDLGGSHRSRARRSPAPGRTSDSLRFGREGLLVDLRYGRPEAKSVGRGRHLVDPRRSGRATAGPDPHARHPPAAGAGAREARKPSGRHPPRRQPRAPSPKARTAGRGERGREGGRTDGRTDGRARPPGPRTRGQTLVSRADFQ